MLTTHNIEPLNSRFEARWVTSFVRTRLQDAPEVADIVLKYIFGGEVTGCVAKLLLFELVAKTRLLDHLTRRLVVGMVLGLAISPTDFSNMTVSKDLHKYNS